MIAHMAIHIALYPLVMIISGDFCGESLPLSGRDSHCREGETPLWSITVFYPQREHSIRFMQCHYYLLRFSCQWQMPLNDIVDPRPSLTIDVVRALGLIPKLG